MINYILQQAQDSPIIQKLLGSREVPPGRYNRVSGVGRDSKNVNLDIQKKQITN